MADQHVLADQRRIARPRCPGRGGSTWRTLPSWMLVRAPIRIRFTSPRSTQLYQMLASGPISMSPISRAPGATKAAGSIARRLAVEGDQGHRRQLSRADVVDDRRVELREARIVIVELRRAGVMPSRSIRPQLGSLPREGDRDHPLARRARRRQVERGDRRLLGIALPPGVLAQPPADLDTRPRSGCPGASAILSPQKPSSSPSALRSTAQKVKPRSACQRISRFADRRRACSASVCTPPSQRITAGVLVWRMNGSISSSRQSRRISRSVSIIARSIAAAGRAGSDS